MQLATQAGKQWRSATPYRDALPMFRVTEEVGKAS
jgi:hypothetical protein